MIISRNLDLLLIKFPIIFPLLYFTTLSIYPEYEFVIVFVTLLILAEPHFGATWPFFINKVNKNIFLNQKLIYIILPLIIFLASIIGYFYFNTIFLLLFFLFNVIHVTRQSFGISKLYISNKIELNFQKFSIYFFAIIFFIIGLFRFYLNLFDGYYFLLLNSIVIFIIFCFSLIYIFKFKFTENFLMYLTGIIMFLPMCFVEKPIHGIVMGVTMHYVQYLALTYKITLKRKKLNFIRFDFKSINLEFISFIIFYGLIMTIFSFSNQIININYSYLLIIPITGQLLHFYLDSLLWRFSDKHNRDVSLKYLKEKF